MNFASPPPAAYPPLSEDWTSPAPTCAPVPPQSHPSPLAALEALWPELDSFAIPPAAPLAQPPALAPTPTTTTEFPFFETIDPFFLETLSGGAADSSTEPHYETMTTNSSSLVSGSAGASVAPSPTFPVASPLAMSSVPSSPDSLVAQLELASEEVSRKRARDEDPDYVPFSAAAVEPVPMAALVAPTPVAAVPAAAPVQRPKAKKPRAPAPADKRCGACGGHSTRMCSYWGYSLGLSGVLCNGCRVHWLAAAHTVEDCHRCKEIAVGVNEEGHAVRGRDREKNTQRRREKRRAQRRAQQG